MFFGLVRYKDVDLFLKKEIDYYENERKNLTDINKIIKENENRMLSNYVECIKNIRTFFYSEFKL